MLVMLSLSNTSRARSWFLALRSSAGVTPSRAHAVDLGERRCFERRERRAVGGGDRDGVEERLLPSARMPPLTDDASPVLTSA